MFKLLLHLLINFSFLIGWDFKKLFNYIKISGRKVTKLNPTFLNYNKM